MQKMKNKKNKTKSGTKKIVSTMSVTDMARNQRHIYLLEKLNKKQVLTPKELREFEIFEQPQIERTLTTSQIMKLLGVNRVTLYQYLKKGLPCSLVENKNLFNEKEVMSWMADHPNLGGEPGRPKDPQSEKMADQKLRKETALATKHEIEVGRMSGELIPLDKSYEVYSEILISIRNKFLHLPAAISGQLAGLDAETIENLLENRISEIFKAVASTDDIKTSLIARHKTSAKN